MRFLLFCALCLFNTSVFLAQELSNSNYYVWAKSGLSLRESPDKNSKKLTIIGYSENVTFISNTFEAFTVTEFNGFDYTDNWFKIKHKNLTGYVFGGYLSKTPPPNILDETNNLTTYLNRVFTKTGYVIYDRYEDCNDDDSNCITSSQTSYKEGASYSFWTGEGGGTETLSIPNLNILQAYILGTIFCETYKEFEIKYYEKPLPTIIVLRDDVGCDFTITALGNYTIIHWSGGC